MAPCAGWSFGPRLFALCYRDEFLCTLTINIAHIQVGLVILDDAVHPHRFARFETISDRVVLVVTDIAQGDGPYLLHASGSIEAHEDLIFIFRVGFMSQPPVWR